MKIISSINEMQDFAFQARKQAKRIGFVPTMGFLHEGHLSLVRKAKEISDIVVVSIFVNPTQFGPSEDFAKYPQDFSKDKELCSEEGVDVIFTPSADDIYPDGYSAYIKEDQLSQSLCGASRPGHFSGVLTIVAKLFNIVQPNISVFGQKDAQQAYLIKKMAYDMNFPVEIVVAPIVREPDGLAMSSRNTYLSAEERKKAVGLYDSLCEAQILYDHGERDAEVIKGKMKDVVEDKGSVEIDYIEVVECITLKPVVKIADKVLVALAVKIGQTRLIDNLIIGG